jgi:hypothetical protein
VKAREGQDLHRPLNGGVVAEEILCVQEERVVGQDWCVRWQNRWLQIGPEHGPLQLPRRCVLIKHLANGKLLMEHKGQRLSFEEIKTKPEPAKQKKEVVNNRRYKPAANHPWKSGPAVDPLPLGNLTSAQPK